jgi:hypothetical protein
MENLEVFKILMGAFFGYLLISLSIIIPRLIWSWKKEKQDKIFNGIKSPADLFKTQAVYFEKRGRGDFEIFSNAEFQNHVEFPNEKRNSNSKKSATFSPKSF